MRKLFKMLLFIGTLIIPGISFCIEVRLVERTVVEGENIYLADLSQTPLNEEMGKIMVGQSPYPGDKREISKELVRTRIRQVRPKEEVVLSGPEVIIVERAYRVITQEDLIQIVEAELKARWGKKEMVNVRSVSNPIPVVVPTGNLQYIVEFPSLGGTKGQLPVSILFMEGERFRKRVTLTAHLTTLGEVLVAKAHLPRGKVLEVQDLEVVVRDLNEAPKDVISSMEAALGKVLKRFVSQGEALRLSALEEPILIKRGQLVTILAENERLKITALGMAQENGVKGDIIKVTNVDSKKVVQGRVVEKDTVRVEF